jgi:hypothetical protein
MDNPALANSIQSMNSLAADVLGRMEHVLSDSPHPRLTDRDRNVELAVCSADPPSRL